MWVYTKNRDTELRLDLKQVEGFWLDHWLFLHADETNRLWSCRPLGVRTVGEMAINIRSRVDGALRRSIKEELVAYQGLASFFPEPPPTTAPSYCTKRGSWPKEWQQWLGSTQDPDFSASLRNALVEALIEAIETPDAHSVAFLNRRLASEMADTYPSDRSILQSTLRMVLRQSNQRALFTDRVRNLLTEPRILRDYSVQFLVAPTPISGQVARWQFPYPCRLDCDEAEEHHQVARILRGIEIKAQAPNPERALTGALAKVREILKELRVRHYVRTNLYGSAMVSELVDEQLKMGADEPVTKLEWAKMDDLVHLALPQPFWTKKGFRKGVPYLPSFENSSVPAKHRWRAARWHVSQAVDVWPEDIHSAASEVWQAIESFAGGKSKSAMTDLVREYCEIVPRNLLKYLADCLKNQVGKFKHVGMSPDWYWWRRGDVDILKWLGRVTHPRSSNHFKHWEKPAAPLFLFGDRVGLLILLGKHIHGIQKMDWMNKRIGNDIRHLYAIRNRAVHRGERIATDRWAGFVARLGLEVLLTVINHRFEHNGR